MYGKVSLRDLLLKAIKFKDELCFKLIEIRAKLL